VEQLGPFEDARMKRLSPLVHGIIDYATLLLISGLSEFARLPLNTENFLSAAGFALFGLAVFTDNQLGFFKLIPFRWHQPIELGGSVLVLFAPLLWGFSADSPSWVICGAISASLLILSLSTDYHGDTKLPVVEKTHNAPPADKEVGLRSSLWR